MLTKQQKEEIIKSGEEALGKSKSVVLVDFTGTPADGMNKFRQSLKEKQSSLKIIKKRLLRIILKKVGIEYDATELKAPVGTIFISGGIEDVASDVYKFGKENADFKILGGYNVSSKEFISDAIVTEIGQLPSREILLGQLLGMFTSPLKKFLFVMNEKSKKIEKVVA